MWRVESGQWSVFVVSSAYRVTCDALNLRALRVACLHLGSWTLISLSGFGIQGLGACPMMYCSG